MDNSLQKIFLANITILYQSEQVIRGCRSQNYSNAVDLIIKTIDQLSSVIDLIVANKEFFNNIISESDLTPILIDILQSQKSDDYILTADIFENLIIPIFTSIQHAISSDANFKLLQFGKKNYDLLKKCNRPLYQKLKADTFNSPSLDNYQVEITSIGVNTLKKSLGSHSFYFHSNINPLKEGDYFADAYFDNDINEYIVLGLGLGYHIRSLLARNNEVLVEIYEHDINIIYLAIEYSDLSDMLTLNNVKLIYDPDFILIKKKIQNCLIKSSSDLNNSFVLHRPSLRNIENQAVKELFNEYFLLTSSIKNQSQLLDINFSKNITLQDPVIDQIRAEFKNCNLIIAAGGPSLDKNIQQLSNLPEGFKLMVVGTVYKKFIQMGIIPHYVIISDPLPKISRQIADIDTSNSALIYLATVNSSIPLNYKGRRYIVFQKGFLKSENYTNQIQTSLYEVGGSVSTLALDVAQKMQCEKIIFVGLDLAYTNMKSHADNTASQSTINRTDLKMVPGTIEEYVYTGTSLNIYRKWIEKHIGNTQNLEIINATEGGALIKGMTNAKLSDILSEYL